MKTTLSFLVVAAIGLVGGGCGAATLGKSRTSVKTKWVDRTTRISEAAVDLRAAGYSEEQANRLAARNVPFQETVYSESIRSILAGDAERRKFHEDLAKSLRKR